jgi:hypothetical protein
MYHMSFDLSLKQYKAFITQLRKYDRRESVAQSYKPPSELFLSEDFINLDNCIKKFRLPRYNAVTSA